MKYYIDRSTGELFAYESDGSQDSLIREGLELLDAKGLAKVRAAQAAASAPTPGQILAAANSERDSRLAVAGLRIAPLQDAVDRGRATDDEKERLILWKDYRVDVNRVTDQAGFPEKIVWPVSPA